MELQLVESSMIQAVGYDEPSQTLVVIFNSGRTYEYYEVPPGIYTQLMASDSKGSYMRSFVIDCYSYGLIKKKRR